MAVALLPDPLWDLVEPFLPIPPRRPRGGRPRVSNRACFTGIVFVLRSGIPWQMLPQELGCGSGMTCWRRLRDWQRALRAAYRSRAHDRREPERLSQEAPASPVGTPRSFDS